MFWLNSILEALTPASYLIVKAGINVSRLFYLSLRHKKINYAESFDNSCRER